MAIEASFGFLFDIALIMIGAMVMSYIVKLFKQPAILGYVIAGAILGPLGMGIISSQGEMLALSELGIAFLLFGAGIEIDFNKLKGVGLVSGVGAVFQVLLTFAAGFGLSMWLGVPFIESLYLGAILAFSSTMVVIKILGDKNLLNSLSGRLMIAVLVMQDVLIIFVIALLNNINALDYTLVIQTIFNGIGLAGIAIIANKFLFPSMLKFSAASEELLFLTAVGTCFTFMGIANFLGFSIAIGAFIGGIALSGFEYNVEIEGQIRSLRDFFSTIFFVSLGLQIGLIDATFLGIALELLFVVLIFKPAITSLLFYMFGYDGRTSLNVGFGLSQVSEFSFILAATGLASGVLSPEMFSLVTVVTIGSIILTPYFFNHNILIYNIISWPKRKLNIETSKFFGRRMPKGKEPEHELKDHVVLLGGHRMGSRVIANLKDKMELLVIDHDPERIEFLTKQGINCIYGDIYNDRVIEQANLTKAKAVIITVHDKDIVASIVDKVESQNRKVVTIARADHTRDAVDLYELHADIVVMPELFTGRKIAQYLGEMFLKEHEARSLTKIRNKMINILEDTLESKHDGINLQRLKKATGKS